MHAHPLDMRRAAPIRQDSGRPHVLPDRSEFGRNSMMSQPLANITFSEEGKVEVATIATNLYRQILLEVQGVEALLRDAGVPRPPEAAQLYAFLMPRQAVQR